MQSRKEIKVTEKKNKKGPKLLADWALGQQWEPNPPCHLLLPTAHQERHGRMHPIHGRGWPRVVHLVAPWCR